MRTFECLTISNAPTTHSDTHKSAHLKSPSFPDRQTLHATLQGQNADVEVFQLAEGVDEVQFLLDGWRTVCDQLETPPDEDNKQLKQQGMTNNLFHCYPII